MFKPWLCNHPMKLVPQSFLLKIKIIVSFTSELSRRVFMKYTSGTGALKTDVCFSWEQHRSRLARRLRDTCRKVMAWWLLGSLVHQWRKEVGWQELLGLT